jgi:hypothetical protein
VRRLAAAIAAALLLWAPAAAATTGPDEPSATAESPSGESETGESPTDDEDAVDSALLALPAAAREWFRTEGLRIAAAGVADLDVEDQEDGEVTLGLARPVLTWSDGFLAGVVTTSPFVDSGDAIAPILLGGNAVGVLIADRTADPIAGRVETIGSLAGPLAALSVSTAVVHDERTDAWYTFAGGEVAPLDDTAASLLSGSVPLSTYQPFLLGSEAGGENDETGSTPLVPVVAGAIAVGVVLVAAGVIVWLRTEEEDEDDEPHSGRLRGRLRDEVRKNLPDGWRHRR